MHSWSLSRCITAALGLLLSVAAQANRYTLVDLGEFKFPEAVNTSRNVAGQAGSAKSKAAVWRGGDWHPLGSRGSIGLAINGRGDVVGVDVGRPIIWPRREPSRIVALPDGAEYGVASGLAQDRTIVGQYANPATGKDHCFIVDPAGSPADLGLMGSGDTCHAIDVNGQHQVVGWGNLAPGGRPSAFLWQDGQFVQLGLLPGGDSSSPYAVNQSGDVVGFASSAERYSHAFRWRAGVLTDLGTDARYMRSSANDINDHGDIVGDATTRDGTLHAVRFAGGRIIELAREVDELGDWLLDVAISVNNEGVIVGQARRQSGGGHDHLREHGFMLLPVTDR